MSLYDQYFSEKNKSHMFSLITKLLTHEMGESPLNISHYCETFHKLYPEVFQRSEADTLIRLNKELVDTVGPTILMYRPPVTQEVSADDIGGPDMTHVTLYSGDRIPTSKHRYNYSIRLPDEIRGLHIYELIIPGESTPLFSFPELCLRLTVDGAFHDIPLMLKEHTDLGERKFMTYFSHVKTTIQRTDPVIQIELLDHKGAPCNPLIKDTHECYGKPIIYNSRLYFCLNMGDFLHRSPFSLHDTLSMTDTHDVTQLTTIQQSIGKYLMCSPLSEVGGMDLEGPLKIRNQSVQHRLTIKGANV
jgi:hypothetical protein